MISFFEWFSSLKKQSLPWVIFGQGPSFSKHVEFRKVDIECHTMGLNRVCRERHVFLTHAIDLGVLHDIPDLPLKTTYLLMPWHPHVEWRATPQTLEEIASEVEVLSEMERSGRLLWYNLSSWAGAPRAGSPVVKVAYFSAEAAVRMLAIAGVRKIRTLGIDGGSQLAKEFSFTKPLKAGHATYSLQQPEIDSIVKEYGLDYAPLS